jgi:N-acetylglucosamine-6-phosphate deacetylase
MKIVTIAPELNPSGDFIQYLHSKGIKVSAGHCEAADLSNVNQVTHLYNAMGAFSHRGESTVVRALSDNNIYTEIIADSMHVSDEVLKLTFKIKPLDKILLISDALPLAHSSKHECTFAGQTIYNNDGKLVNKDGVFAGSSSLLCDIIKNLTDKNILKFEDAVKCASSNQQKYHNLNNKLKLYWNEQNKIEKIEII